MGYIQINRIKTIIKKYNIEIIILLVSLTFSIWLMFSSFSYQDGNMLIATKAWSDFASHIPLIRSFSFGDNFFSLQYPLFSGSPIKYHFLFYALVGFFEKLGLRIDYALNIPSVLGFSLLLVMIYIFSKEIFKSKAVGILSVIFFLFNGSLSFIKFFTEHPISKNVFLDIFQNNKFASFGPYDGNIVSAFWNLNIYTNQRHLALSYGLSLFIVYLFLKFKNNEKKENIKKSLLIGTVLGLSFILNMAVFLMTLLIFSSMFLFFNKKRVYILITIVLSSIIALPIYIYTQQGASIFKLSLHVGYLVTDLNIINFINYWFQNLGLHFLLIPLAFVFADKNLRKIFVCFFILFLVGNLVQFSPEIAANHKFFNYFMIIGVMFSAYFLVVLWNKKSYLKPFVLIFVFFLIFSGIIDLFPIFNDSKIALSDYPNNKNISWIMKNTKPDSVFLNTQYLYDDASLAGRKIFLGWPYFAWSQGYDTDKRYKLMSELLGSENKVDLCKKLNSNKIDYIEINGDSLNDPNLPKVSNIFDKEFNPIYKNSQNNYKIYSVLENCKRI